MNALSSAQGEDMNALSSAQGEDMNALPSAQGGRHECFAFSPWGEGGTVGDG
jgi:hypothetical protein